GRLDARASHRPGGGRPDGARHPPAAVGRAAREAARVAARLRAGAARRLSRALAGQPVAMVVGAASGQAYITYGWDEMLVVLDNLDSALAEAGTYDDPADSCGEGWCADEALGTALYCLLR